MVRLSNFIEDYDEYESGRWSLKRIKIMPTLEDLHYAIKLNDPRKVAMLASHTTINLNSSLRSCTAISLAVYQQATEIVHILLENGANANKLSRDWNGRLETPLFSACRLGLYDIAKALLESGKADVNITDFYNHTPLWIATRERRLDLVELLISHGADLNVADKWSQCPLYLATKYLGRSQIAKTLIRHGCKLDLTDVEGHGALYWSLANRQLDVFKLLIYAGAHINKKERDYLTSKNLSPEIRDNAEFIRWLHIELSQPPSLLRQGAAKLRIGLSKITGGKSIWAMVDSLPLSDSMSTFLRLQNICI